MARRRRQSWRGYGKLDVGLDAILPPLVGGGAAMGTTLMLRGFAKPINEETQKENWYYKWAGFLGAGAGVLASVVLGPFQGWGAALVGSMNAIFTGTNAQLYNKVVEGKDWGYMVARRAPYAQPVIYRGSNLKGMGYMQGRKVNKAFPENVTQFPATHAATVNTKAWGGRVF